MASLDRVQNTRIPGTTGAAGRLQRCKTARPTVAIYLDELPIKCVNSEFQTVDAHPKEGCLKWLRGTMSEPPMEITLDKNGSLYDPAGTES